jgi:hypothetical protein
MARRVAHARIPAVACLAAISILALSAVGQVHPGQFVAFDSVASPAGYTISEVTLSDFADLTSYVYNYRIQYPTVGFAGPCAGSLMYITVSSRLACYEPATGRETGLSGPLTLLHQRTVGLRAQIDNAFLLDTPYDVALLYGNASTQPGPVTVEVVNLTTGLVQTAQTPVEMGNAIQCDYIGNGEVVTFNSTPARGEPTFFTNVSNGTSWYSGQDVGVAPNNIYWVWQLHSFIDIQGKLVSQYEVEHQSLVIVARFWLNDSSVTEISAVAGTVYNGRSLALWEATNEGRRYLILNSTAGRITPKGSYTYFSDYLIYIQRYSYNTSFVWAVHAPRPALTGPTVLFDPFNNSTLPAPNLVGREEGSGANLNFESTDPYTTDVYLSFNASLLNASALASNSFVWACRPSGPGNGGCPQPASLAMPGGGYPFNPWALGAFAVVSAATVVVAVIWVRRAPRAPHR